jgi:hypothetical protein
MKKVIVLSVIAGIVIAMLVIQAGASLVPMSWGYPVSTQSASLTAFQKDTALATDDEAAAVAFPDSTGLTDSVFGTSFPTISQTTAQSQMLNSISFMNEDQNNAFAYPFLSIGGSPIPSMGFF